MAQVTNPAPMKVVPEAVVAAPFPVPKTKAQKQANGIARNKRREENRKARLAAATAAVAAIKADEPKVEHALVDEDKPIVSYDDVGGDHVAEQPTPSYSSDMTPGVAAIPDTTARNDPPAEEASNDNAEAKPEVILTRKQRNRLKYLARQEAKKAAAEAEPIIPPVKAEGEYPVTNKSEADPVEEEVHVDDALVEAGSFAELDKKEKADEKPVAVSEEPVVVSEGTGDDSSAADPAEGMPGESSVDEPVSEEMTDEPTVEEATTTDEPPAEVVSTEPVAEEVSAAEEPAAEPVVEPVVEPVPDSANEPVPDKPAGKPVLKLVSDNPNDPKYIAARKFYGDAFTPERAELLTKALFWLDKAIEAELAGDAMKLKLAWKAARKNEAEALDYKIDITEPLAMAA